MISNPKKYYCLLVVNITGQMYTILRIAYHFIGTYTNTLGRILTRRPIVHLIDLGIGWWW